MRRKKKLRFGPVARNGIRVSVESQCMLLEALDYHADPIHLTRSELRELGLILPRKEPPGLQPSAALQWRPYVARGEPRGALPDERCYLGAFVLARVAGGMDVFVISYSGAAKRVEPATLKELGLRVRKTPLRRRRRRPQSETTRGDS